VKIQVLNISGKTSVYLFIKYRNIVLSRGMQHVLYDIDKVFKILRERERALE
jgi:hypothetical protein